MTSIKEDQQMEVSGHKGNLVIPSTDALGKLESAETGMSLNTKYKTQEDWIRVQDEPINCYFMGLKEIPNKDGDAVQCAVFMSQSEVFLAAQLVLIEAVRNQVPGQGVRITYKGKKSNVNSEGKTNLFDVVRLNVRVNLDQ